MISEVVYVGSRTVTSDRAEDWLPPDPETPFLQRCEAAGGLSSG